MRGNKSKAILYIVHAVDTEGPLYESFEATFERLKDIFGIDLEPNAENLRKIQNKELDLKGKEDIVAEAFAPHVLNYNDNWDKLDLMLKRIMSPGFRNKIPDSFGGGWIFNWHCVDHAGYLVNPRRRDIGIHNIFDHYQRVIKETGSFQDAVHWHFHPMSTYREAHRCATSFLNSPHLYEILCRRIIEKKWFPKVFRAGFQAERPDSHWFLEQWIPFDLTNMAMENTEDLEKQSDLCRGRFGDWRLAPSDWSVYQPSHDNYQLKGNCRRWIARALNLGTRLANISQKDVDQAFARVSKGLPTLLAIANHDFRDLEPEIDLFRDMLTKSAEKYPQVRFKYSEAVEAFRSVIYGPGADCGEFGLDLNLTKHSNHFVLEVRTKNGKVFGPQPFLAIKTKSNRYIHDNFDFDTSLEKWSYTFDRETVRPDDLAAVGVASNDKYANTFTEVINLEEELHGEQNKRI